MPRGIYDRSKSKPRGRKPIGEEAMTAAEAKQRSRQKMREEGIQEITIKLPKEVIETFNAVATIAEVDRNTVISSILKKYVENARTESP